MDVNSFVIGYKKGKASVPSPETQEKEITITENGTTEVAPDEGKLLAKVTVNTDVAGGGGAELNIAYGDTPPEDTTKLWVKTDKPSGVIVSANASYNSKGVETIETLDIVLPYAKSGHSAEEVDGKIYLIGGYSGDTVGGNIMFFDPEKQSFVTLGLKTYDATSVATAVAGKKIYTFGGYKSALLGTSMCFDTEAMTTITINGPGQRQSGFAVTVGQYIYIFGGAMSSNLDEIWRYDINNNNSEKLTTVLPNKGASICGALVGNKIFLCTGTSGIYSFDTTTETLKQEYAGFTSWISNRQCVAVGTKIYIFGTTGTSKSIYRYDTELKELKKLDAVSAYPLASATATLVGNRVYILGGSADGVRLTRVECFTIGEDEIQVPSGTLSIIPKTDGNTFPIVNGDTIKIELGVKSVFKGNADGVGEPIEAALYKDGTWTTI